MFGFVVVIFSLAEFLILLLPLSVRVRACVKMYLLEISSLYVHCAVYQSLVLH